MYVQKYTILTYVLLICIEENTHHNGQPLVLPTVLVALVPPCPKIISKNDDVIVGGSLLRAIIPLVWETFPDVGNASILESSPTWCSSRN